MKRTFALSLILSMVPIGTDPPSACLSHHVLSSGAEFGFNCYMVIRISSTCGIDVGI